MSTCRGVGAEMLRGSGLEQWLEGQGHIDLHCSAEEHGEKGRTMDSDRASSADCSDMASAIEQLLQEEGSQDPVRREQ
jgi:hypothetical protein